jgi:membrane protein
LGRHNILTNASAVALRALVAVIPLTLFGLAFLGAFGLQDVWRNQLGPTIQDRLTHTTYHAIDVAVERILTNGTAGLLIFAGVLTIWDLSSVVRACMGGLDAIYEQSEERSTIRRFAVSVGLGLAIGVCIVGAILLMTAARGWGGNGNALGVFLLVVRWFAAVGLLGVAVGLLVRYAPTHRRAASWVGLGTVLVVLSWVVMSLVFGLFVRYVANFKSAAGQLTVLLVLTTYIYSSSIVFLVGVQVDELLRKRAPDVKGAFAQIRHVLGR